MFNWSWVKTCSLMFSFSRLGLDNWSIGLSNGGMGSLSSPSWSEWSWVSFWFWSHCLYILNHLCLWFFADRLFQSYSKPPYSYGIWSVWFTLWDCRPSSFVWFLGYWISFGWGYPWIHEYGFYTVGRLTSFFVFSSLLGDFLGWLANRLLVRA